MEENNNISKNQAGISPKILKLVRYWAWYL